MAQVVWTINFLGAQGVEISKNILYQDNKSAMLLERNGFESAGKRSKHLNIRYFLWRTLSGLVWCALSTARLRKWSQISLPNHCKARNSKNLGPRSWECSNYWLLYGAVEERSRNRLLYGAAERRSRNRLLHGAAERRSWKVSNCVEMVLGAKSTCLEQWR